MKKMPLYLVAGPTASGKSALAAEIARQEQGIVINADAMQVYVDLPLLTAQPDAALHALAPHALYAFRDPAQPFSAALWRDKAKEAILQAQAQGHTPVLVGGTGLYFKTLLEGLADIPPIPPTVRRAALDLYNEKGGETFRNLLRVRDPESAARLPAGDRQRLVRAYEVVIHTGRPLPDWHKDAAACENAFFEPFALRPLLILPPREKLYAACNVRFEKMIGEGALDEVRALLARYPAFFNPLGPDYPASKILGLREIAAFLADAIPLELVLAKAQQATRNYAKRQITWFRNQWKETPAFPVKILEQGPI